MITLRHNRLVQTLSDIAKLAGAATSIEPRVPHTNSIIPDLTIALDGLFYSVDVSVVNPLAPSFLRTAKRHSLAVAEIKAKQKKTKYSEQAKSWNAAFFPFVLQVTGGFHHDARELLQLLSESPLVKDSAAFLKEARYKILKTLYSGNFMIQAKGLQYVMMSAFLSQNYARAHPALTSRPMLNSE